MTPSTPTDRPRSADQRLAGGGVRRLPAELTVVVALAKLFQKLESSPTQVAPSQYRAVAQRLAEALAQAPAGEALDTVLRLFPAVAELYENVQYRHAGLCRQPLERALNAELAARELLGRVGRAGGAGRG